jgi:ribosomal protein S18 acetylase RimI-like enzyme
MAYFSRKGKVMDEIRYTMELSAVDWDEMKQTLLEDDFDNLRTPDEYKESFENSFTACVAYAGEKIIGTARVLSDGVCNAYVVDVWTYTPYRRKGVASEMMRLLEEKLYGQHIYLFTDSAPWLYRSLGFKEQPIGMGKVAGKWLGRYEPKNE